MTIEVRFCVTGTVLRPIVGVVKVEEGSLCYVVSRGGMVLSGRGWSMEAIGFYGLSVCKRQSKEWPCNRYKSVDLISK